MLFNVSNLFSAVDWVKQLIATLLVDDVTTGLSATILEGVKLNGMSYAIDGQPVDLETGAESDGEWESQALDRWNGPSDGDSYIL